KSPLLAKEWHPKLNGFLKPEMVSWSSGEKVWWLGICGHEWQASIINRQKGNGCPICCGQKVLIGFNDLATTNPDIMSEWDIEKNGILPEKIFRYSTLREKYWWKCNLCEESWQSTIKNRTRGRGCPNCRFKSLYKKIKNIDTGEVFDSVTAAAEKYKCSSSSITNCCKGRINSVFGYHWVYYEE
ncbi:MAG: hypothetical protein IJ274_10725, partial [Lachnospiraceae bacterium]|nr:hypothetical protein [Lachnospiraceae bacterium]